MLRIGCGMKNWFGMSDRFPKSCIGGSLDKMFRILIDPQRCIVIIFFIIIIKRLNSQLRNYNSNIHERQVFQKHFI